MSELIGNAERRKALLKHMIRQLHEGTAPEQVRAQLVRVLGQVPYHDVVEVEQSLIADGLPVEEILALCDLHSAALRGAIDHSGATAPPDGHPAHTFHKENEALRWELDALAGTYARIDALDDGADVGDLLHDLQIRFNNLMDVEKHYLRKEHLLFPFLERHGITGPPKVMWGKHDEVRALLAAAQSALRAGTGPSAGEAGGVISLLLRPASAAVGEMIDKEEQILLPMCLDTLSEAEWIEIARQSAEYGFCLYDPAADWQPAAVPAEDTRAEMDERIRLPSGTLTAGELQTILNTIPFDLTFVDRDDTVRYFTQGRERIFSRSRAILGRQVQYCHPPASVSVVQRILDDFRSGREDHARFWITLRGRFVSIEYFALRSPDGNYLGCLEVSQDLTDKRALQGEQRLLAYVAREGSSSIGEPAAESGNAAGSDTVPGDGAGSSRPAWAEPGHADRSFDARPMLERGGHPLDRVLQDVGELAPGEVLELITPFVPAPLIDIVRARGLEVHSAMVAPGECFTYFRAPPRSHVDS